MSRLKYMLLNLPNPPGRNIYREFAGGFGTLGSLSSEVLLPTYLLYGASAVEKSGCSYEVIDGQAMKYDSSKVVDAVEEIKPDVLITWVSLPSLDDDLNLLRSIKKTAPETFIVVLGGICNVMPEEVLGDGVDLVVKGSYPHYNLILNIARMFMDNPVNQDTFELIGGAVYLKDDKIVHSSLKQLDENLNKLSLQIYRSLPLDEYIGDFGDARGKSIKCIPIVTSVGCPYGCTYCPYPLAYGTKVVHKSIDNILAEIEFLKTNFDIQGFIFRDQLFTYNKERVERLCDEIIRKDYDIKWLVEARVDQVNSELLLKMKEAGCFRIHYGVETGTPEMLMNTGKPGLNVENIKHAFQTTKDIGIFAMAHIILGLPGENTDTFENTLTLLYDLNPDGISLNICTPYPGTKLFEMAVENEWIKTYDWSEYTSFNAIMQTNDLKIEDLTKAKNDIKNKFRNFKLQNDPNYRKLYIKTLPRKIYYRYIVG